VGFGIIDATSVGAELALPKLLALPERLPESLEQRALARRALQEPRSAQPALQEPRSEPVALRALPEPPH